MANPYQVEAACQSKLSDLLNGLIEVASEKSCADAWLQYTAFFKPDMESVVPPETAQLQQNAQLYVDRVAKLIDIMMDSSQQRSPSQVCKEVAQYMEDVFLAFGLVVA